MEKCKTAVRKIGRFMPAAVLLTGLMGCTSTPSMVINSEDSKGVSPFVRMSYLLSGTLAKPADGGAHPGSEGMPYSREKGKDHAALEALELGYVSVKGAGHALTSFPTQWGPYLLNGPGSHLMDYEAHVGQFSYRVGTPRGYPVYVDGLLGIVFSSVDIRIAGMSPGSERGAGLLYAIGIGTRPWGLLSIDYQFSDILGVSRMYLHEFTAMIWATRGIGLAGGYRHWRLSDTVGGAPVSLKWKGLSAGLAFSF